MLVLAACTLLAFQEGLYFAWMVEYLVCGCRFTLVLSLVEAVDFVGTLMSNSLVGRRDSLSWWRVETIGRCLSCLHTLEQYKTGFMEHPYIGDALRTTLNVVLSWKLCISTLLVCVTLFWIFWYRKRLSPVRKFQVQRKKRYTGRSKLAKGRRKEETTNVWIQVFVAVDYTKLQCDGRPTVSSVHGWLWTNHSTTGSIAEISHWRTWWFEFLFICSSEGP